VEQRSWSSRFVISLTPTKNNPGPGSEYKEYSIFRFREIESQIKVFSQQKCLFVEL
jgi:hypothetical protein